ncbi:MAG: hypothetical protein V1824_01210, partial [archaeon]
MQLKSQIKNIKKKIINKYNTNKAERIIKLNKQKVIEKYRDLINKSIEKSLQQFNKCEYTQLQTTLNEALSKILAFSNKQYGEKFSEAIKPEINYIISKTFLAELNKKIDEKYKLPTEISRDHQDTIKELYLDIQDILQTEAKIPLIKSAINKKIKYDNPIDACEQHIKNIWYGMLITNSIDVLKSLKQYTTTGKTSNIVTGAINMGGALF